MSIDCYMRKSWNINYFYVIKMGSPYNKDSIKFKVKCDFLFIFICVLGSEEGSGQEAAMRTKKNRTLSSPTAQEVGMSTDTIWQSWGQVPVSR